LGRIGSAATDAAAALREALNSESCQLQVEAALALWCINRRIEQALPVLIGALYRESHDDCHVAARALSEIGPDAKAAVPALGDQLRNRLNTDKTSILSALEAIGSADSLPALVDWYAKLKHVADRPFEEDLDLETGIAGQMVYGDGEDELRRILVEELQKATLAVFDKIGTGAIPKASAHK
jgi:hypothetical protein